MRQLKGFVVKIYPNNTQIALLEQTFGCTRFIYNQMLAERIDVYDHLKDDKDMLYKHKYKTEAQYKELFPFLRDVSSRALQQARINLDSAYKGFFKSGRGFPKFKSKHHTRKSYREPNVNNCIKIIDNKVKLLKLGTVKFRGLDKSFYELSPIIKSVTISKDKVGDYQASILTEVDVIIKENKGYSVGIDVGLKEFITTSDAVIYSGLKETIAHYEKLITYFQRKHSKKQKGSSRREKLRVKIARLHRKLVRIKNHYFYSIANELCSENQTISLESLHIKGMIKNRKLSKAISNASWRTFITILEKKAIEYGTKLLYIDRWFASTKTCSVCGTKHPVVLGEDFWTCLCCETTHDRDVNAAINIEVEGLRLALQA